MINIGLMIFLLFLFIVVIMSIIILHHWKINHYHKKLTRKKQSWEPELFAYLSGENSTEELAKKFANDYKILKDFLMPYLKNLKGEDYQQLVELAGETGITDYYLDRLAEGSRKEKIRAANFLGKVKAKQALPLLKEIINQDDSDLMIAAAWSIAEIGDASYFSPVLNKVINQTYMTYEGITELLTKFDRTICKEIEQLLSGWLTGEQDLEKNFQAAKDIIISLLIDLLGHFRYVEGVYLLEKILRQETSTEIIIHIFKALTKIGYPIETDLYPYLNHENWVIRSQAVRYAGVIEAEDYLADYKNLLQQDKNWWVKYYAGRTILQIEGEDYLQALAASREDGSRMSSYLLEQS